MGGEGEEISDLHNVPSTSNTTPLSTISPPTSSEPVPLLNGANLLVGALVSMVIDRAKEVPTRGSARLTDLVKVGMNVMYVQGRGDGG